MAFIIDHDTSLYVIRILHRAWEAVKKHIFKKTRSFVKALHIPSFENLHTYSTLELGMEYAASTCRMSQVLLTSCLTKEHYTTYLGAIVDSLIFFMFGEIKLVSSCLSILQHRIIEQLLGSWSGNRTTVKQTSLNVSDHWGASRHSVHILFVIHWTCFNHFETRVQLSY